MKKKIVEKKNSRNFFWENVFFFLLGGLLLPLKPRVPDRLLPHKPPSPKGGFAPRPAFWIKSP